MLHEAVWAESADPAQKLLRAVNRCFACEEPPDVCDAVVLLTRSAPAAELSRLFQSSNQRIDSQIATHAGLAARLGGTVTDYAEYATGFMGTAAWASAAPMPEPLAGHAPPTSWFLAALRSDLQAKGGLQGDWAQQLAGLELGARRAAAAANGGRRERGLRRGAYSCADGDVGPTTFTQTRGRENAVRLAVGYVFRVLAGGHMTMQSWRDTSRPGVDGMRPRLGYTSYVSLPQLRATQVRPCA